MIWAASEADLPDLLAMGRRRIEVAHKGEFDPTGGAAYLRDLMERGVVLTTGRAMLGGIIYPVPFEKGRTVAVCFFWWSERPGDGVKLLRAFTAWGEAQGASEVSVSPLAGDDEARRILDRLGFEAHETAYTRAI